MHITFRAHPEDMDREAVPDDGLQTSLAAVETCAQALLAHGDAGAQRVTVQGDICVHWLPDPAAEDVDADVDVDAAAIAEVGGPEDAPPCGCTMTTRTTNVSVQVLDACIHAVVTLRVAPDGSPAARARARAGSPTHDAAVDHLADSVAQVVSRVLPSLMDVAHACTPAQDPAAAGPAGTQLTTGDVVVRFARSHSTCSSPGSGRSSAGSASSATTENDVADDVTYLVEFSTTQDDRRVQRPRVRRLGLHS